MNFKKPLLLLQIFFLLLIPQGFSNSFQQKLDGKTSATILAKKRMIPSKIQLNIKGLVQNEYLLNSKDLSSISSVRIRTREVSIKGDIEGVYIYQGIPLYFILEGIAPKKEKSAAFNRPLDMIVSFISNNGKQVHFSYGELTMCDDNDPISLAYHREELFPSKNPKEYKKNKYKTNLTGLRLICPGDRFNNRYLDNIVSIKLWLPPIANNLLPKQQKGTDCISKNIKCIQNKKIWTSSFSGLPVLSFEGWFRIGHGRGIKGKTISKTSGYSLRSFLKHNFQNTSKKDFFIFSACDGYRSLFSWTEIFETSKGNAIALIKTRDGKPLKKGLTLGPLKDFFIDRSIWGLSHIEKITL